MPHSAGKAVSGVQGNEIKKKRDQYLALEAEVYVKIQRRLHLYFPESWIADPHWDEDE